MDAFGVASSCQASHFLGEEAVEWRRLFPYFHLLFFDRRRSRVAKSPRGKIFSRVKFGNLVFLCVSLCLCASNGHAQLAPDFFEQNEIPVV
jgi:hypothetical protein